MAEIEELRDRVAQLEELLGVRHKPHTVRGFSRREWQLIGLFAKRGAVPRELALQAIYGALPDSNQPIDCRIIDQFIFRLRHKLKAYDIKIATELYHGYFVDETNKQKLQDLFDT